MEFVACDIDFDGFDVDFDGFGNDLIGSWEIWVDLALILNRFEIDFNGVVSYSTEFGMVSGGSGTDLGVFGVDLHGICWVWDRFGWIWGRFGLIRLIFYFLLGGLALTRSNVPQVSQTFFYETNSLKGDPQKI